MESAITEWNRRFGIPGTARIVEGNGGLPKVRVTSPRVVGEMYLHGAHVTSWKPAGAEEVLFLSSGFAVNLGPGQQHTMKAHVRVVDL